MTWGPTEAEMTAAIAKVREYLRMKLAPLLRDRETWLAVPFWTAAVANACNVGGETRGEAALHAHAKAGLLDSRLDHRWDPKTGVVSYHEEDREFRLTREAKEELLQLVREEGVVGRSRLGSCVAMCAEAMERAGIEYAFTFWISLAKHARDLDKLAATLVDMAAEPLERGDTGTTLRVIETGRLLDEILNDYRITRACEDAAGKLNDHHRACGRLV